MGATNVESVDYIRVNVGKVDFGDLLHVSGTPMGNAVVCWANSGSVAVIGRVFADSTTFTTARAAITVFDNNGTANGPHTYTASGSFAKSTVISQSFGFSGVLPYDRIEHRAS